MTHARPASRTLLAVVVIGALAALAACDRGKPSPGGTAEGRAGASGAPPGSTGATKITVAAIAVVDTAPLHLGQAKGFFAEQGLDVTVQSTLGGAESVPGVVSGQYQFAFANVISILLAHAKGLPLRVIAAGNYSTGRAEDFAAVVVPPDSPAKTMKDLEGKTVAVNQINNISGVTVRASMRKAGGDPDQLKFIELRFPEMPPALGQHRVDAALVVEPFLRVARDQGARVVASSFVDTMPDLMIAAYLTTADYAKDHADIVKRFTAAINKSLAYAAEHPDEARASLLTYTKIDKAIADKINLPTWKTEISRASLETLADLMVQDKLLGARPDLATLVP
ncbi:MAG TPA: ABC transporter substrate-binding protein [Kofleriaceae bacterium]|nr:ABC transporter substrate-binding protein [Kofleriaceae bacterium]